MKKKNSFLNLKSRIPQTKVYFCQIEFFIKMNRIQLLILMHLISIIDKENNNINTKNQTCIQAAKVITCQFLIELYETNHNADHIEFKFSFTFLAVSNRAI